MGLNPIFTKSYLQKLGNISPSNYRITYSIISVIGLLLILFFNGYISAERLLPVSSYLKYLSMLLTSIGVIIINSAFKQYNFKSFIGLKEEGNSQLNKNGVLSYIRHPIYTGTILIVLGFLLYDARVATLISALCIFVYLPIGIKIEEKKLINMYGGKYLKYKEEVPSLLPRIRISSKLLL